MARHRELQSEEDVYRELGRRLGGQPDETVWQLLVVDRWPEDVISGEESVESLHDKYRERLAIVGQRGAGKPRRAASSEPQHETAPWAAALSEIMALDAAKQPFVRAFRQMVLGGRLLSPEEAQRWLVEKGQASRYRLGPRLDVMGIIAAPRESVWESQLAVKDYVEGKATERASREEYEIDFLYCLADLLQSWYGWLGGTSIQRFVLSGQVPVLPTATMLPLFHALFHPGNGMVILHVSPQHSPREVQELYSRARQTFFPQRQRVRQPDAHELELGVFIARVNDGRTWNAALAAWNEAHDETESYAEVRSFARDARSAYFRVVSSDLKWQGGQQSAEGKR